MSGHYAQAGEKADFSGPSAVSATGSSRVSQKNKTSRSFNAPVAAEQFAAVAAVAKDILVRSPSSKARCRASDLLDHANDLKDQSGTDQGRMRPIVSELLKVVEKTGPLAGAVSQHVGLLRAVFSL